MSSARSCLPQDTYVPCSMVALGAALELLLEAYGSAAQVGRDPWEFALEIGSLRRAGLTNSHLRWLICQGYVAHAEECSRAGEDRRRFRTVGNLRLSKRTCFVLTEAGVRFAGASGRSQGEQALPPPSLERPTWDAVRRELRLGSQVVKRFRQPADSQELILLAFQEEGWPPRIDDPLPPQPSQDGKNRLHRTICNLNRSQENRRILFSGGGDGQSIAWQLLAGSEARAKPERD